jgi:hypothetical protein
MNIEQSSSYHRDRALRTDGTLGRPAAGFPNCRGQ